jgi:Protein of unknown function (DUF1638)
MTAAPLPPSLQRTLIIACGALAREILGIRDANNLAHLDLTCLPAGLHNTPKLIPDAVRAAIREARATHTRIFVAYADCGTGGLLDKVLDEERVERLPGAHCYAFYSGVDAFTARGDADMRAFFLTDFLVRQFDTLVIEGLGIDRHPELRDIYFGNYEKVVYLAQTHDGPLLDEARRAAARLDLAFEHRFVGYGDLAPAIKALTA